MSEGDSDGPSLEEFAQLFNFLLQVADQDELTVAEIAGIYLQACNQKDFLEPVDGIYFVKELLQMGVPGYANAYKTAVWRLASSLAWR